MSSKPLGPALRSFRQLFGEGTVVGLSDAQLLDRFANQGDAVAFEALVGRHGPMVLAVCRGVLKDPDDAQDAFQATFLVLIRRVGSLWSIRGSLGGWLYRVALRIAIRANADAARRRAVETRAGRGSTSGPGSGAENPLRELLPALHEEIGRLPEKLRAPIVLCHLQQMTHAQAAQQLGWTTDTVRGRVARGRELLRSRLTRRGAIPAVGGLTALLPDRQALAAVPRGWVEASVRAATRISAGETLTAGTVSAAAAAFSEEILRTMGFQGLVKIAASVLIGTVALAWGASAALVDGPKPAIEPAQAPAKTAKVQKPMTVPNPSDDDITGTFEVRGVVLDPDGKPVKDARIYVSHVSTGAQYPKSVTDRQPPVTTTDPGGRFSFQFDKAASDWPYGESPGWHQSTIAAIAPGFGPAWIDAKTVAKEGKATLTLVPDDVPIRGRVLDLQGRPVAGAAVYVIGIHQIKGDVDLHAMLNSGEFSTDMIDRSYTSTVLGENRRRSTWADGRFEVRGIGRDRIAVIEVHGAGLQKPIVSAIARPRGMAGPRSAPASGKGMMSPGNRPKGKLYDSAVEIVIGPTKPIVGIVKSRATGKPVAGVPITGDTGGYVLTESDAEGRYRIEGLPKSESYRLIIDPRPETPFLQQHITVSDTDGLKPIERDIELEPGVPIKGHLIDTLTGEAVAPKQITYVALPSNPNQGWASKARISVAKRTFELTVPPGKAMILGAVKTRDLPYLRARLRKEDKGKGIGGEEDKEGRTVRMDAHQAYKLVDVPADAEQITIDLPLERGLSRKGKLVDVEGKPVVGAEAYGLSDAPMNWTLEDENFDVTGIDPEHPRALVFTHKGRKLAGSVILNGAELKSREPLVVRMVSPSVVTGQILDEDKLPLDGATLRLWPNDPLGKYVGLATSMWPYGEDVNFKTDDAGRFRIEGFVPGIPTSIIVNSKSSVLYDPSKSHRDIVVGPGEIRDLGTVTMKARRQ